MLSGEFYAGEKNKCSTENPLWANRQKIWFIQHGESEAHIGRASPHIEDVRLTPPGREKARDIAEDFEEAPDLIITSPYLRAWETASPTRERFPHIPCETWPEVQEFTYLGSLAGQTLTKQERSGKARAFWERNDPMHKDGSGESFAELICRASTVLQKLKQQDGFVVIFTHEQFIRAVQSILEGWMSLPGEPMPMQRFRQLLDSAPLSYGSILEMFVYPERWQRPGTLLERKLSTNTIHHRSGNGKTESTGLISFLNLSFEYRRRPIGFERTNTYKLCGRRVACIWQHYE